MKNFAQDLVKYLSEVFGESQRIIFTAFDVLGIILFFAPRFAQGLVGDEALVRSIGGLIFFTSFLMANFNLYRKLSTEATTSLSESSFLLYSFEKSPYNNVEIQYIGSEPVKDLEVWLSYIDRDQNLKTTQVEEFFPKNDRDMIWNQFKANVLTEGQVIRFHLIQRKSTADAKVTVELKCVGARSHKFVRVSKEFELKL